MDKQSIRLVYLKKRRQMSAIEAPKKSALIAQKLLSSIDWHSICSVHLYDSQITLNEVDTSGILEFLYTNWPQIDVTVGNASPTAPLPSTKYNLIIVPVVAFDAQCNRLGFGGGWYDRFLATQPQAMTIGLAYDFQQAVAIPVEAHDIRLSRVITDRGTF